MDPRVEVFEPPLGGPLRNRDKTVCPLPPRAFNIYRFCTCTRVGVCFSVHFSCRVLHTYFWYFADVESHREIRKTFRDSRIALVIPAFGCARDSRRFHSGRDRKTGIPGKLSGIPGRLSFVQALGTPGFGYAGIPGKLSGIPGRLSFVQALGTPVRRAPWSISSGMPKNFPGFPERTARHPPATATNTGYMNKPMKNTIGS